jgi:hypothetical protein
MTKRPAREFERTQPWLNFEVDLKRAGYRLGRCWERPRRRATMCGAPCCGPSTWRGRSASIYVVAGHYRGAPAGDCEYLLERLCEWMNSDQFKAPDDHPELAPPLAILKAVLAHLYLA